MFGVLKYYCKYFRNEITAAIRVLISESKNQLKTKQYVVAILPMYPNKSIECSDLAIRQATLKMSV